MNEQMNKPVQKNYTYTCGEHSIMQKLIKSLSCTSETKAILCINYMQINKNEINNVKSKKNCSFM